MPSSDMLYARSCVFCSEIVILKLSGYVGNYSSVRYSWDCISRAVLVKHNFTMFYGVTSRWIWRAAIYRSRIHFKFSRFHPHIETAVAMGCVLAREEGGERMGSSIFLICGWSGLLLIPKLRWMILWIADLSDHIYVHIYIYLISKFASGPYECWGFRTRTGSPAVCVDGSSKGGH